VYMYTTINSYHRVEKNNTVSTSSAKLCSTIITLRLQLRMCQLNAEVTTAVTK